MKLLFDENISFRIAKLQTGIFENCSHVNIEGLQNKSDYQIWEFAKKNEFAIVTQDSDFNDLYLLFGFPPKIIWLKVGNLKTNEIAMILNDNNEAIFDFMNNAELGCFEIFRFEK